MYLPAGPYAGRASIQTGKYVTEAGCHIDRRMMQAGEKKLVVLERKSTK
jgi:hypothetical protein